MSGADPLGGALLYTPDPNEPGSSVSHWVLIASPYQLMEAFSTGDEKHAVDVPTDLTLSFLKDIGWP